MRASMSYGPVSYGHISGFIVQSCVCKKVILFVYIFMTILDFLWNDKSYFYLVHVKCKYMFSWREFSLFSSD